MQKPMLPITSGRTGRPRLFVSRPVIVVGTVAVVVSLLGGSLWLVQSLAQLNNQVIATNGADRWASDTRTTAASIPVSAPETWQIGVDPAFSAYYQAHDGATVLGAPVTPGFPIAQGWIQFFTANALLLPGTHGAAAAQTPIDQQIEQLLPDGLKDSHSGIIQLPLLHTLLTVGSQASVGGGLTYLDLRSATNPDQMQPAPTASAASQGEFVQGGLRNGQKLGHVIPPALWAFITRPDVSPDDWQTDVGAPLTDAIPFVNVQYGVSHRLLIQVFWREAFIMDRDVKDANGQPLIEPLDTGLAYLRTLIPPTPALGAHASLWASSALDLLTAPATGRALIHVGQNFPLTVVGAAQWTAGTLWYQARWKAPTSSGEGWAPASGLTFTAPAHPSDAASAPTSATSAAAPGSATLASFNQLSPDLALYLTSQSVYTAAAVYDLTRQRYYAYQPSNQYLMGDSIKLPILVAFLAMTEQQGRRPSSSELNQLATMMNEPADDDAGDDIYNKIGRALGLKDYRTQIGITGMAPENDDWVYSMAQPLAMVQLLALLHEGNVLTAQDRALVFSLLANVAPEDQIGVGDTRPQGASVTMKDGWVIGTDDKWAMNSSGIVTVGGETYIISVSSEHLTSLEQGQDIARQVCTRVATLLK